MRLQLFGGSLALLWMVTPLPADAAPASDALRAAPASPSAVVVVRYARHHPATAPGLVAPLARTGITSPRAAYTLLSRDSDTTVVSGVRIAAVRGRKLDRTGRRHALGGLPCRSSEHR